MAAAAVAIAAAIADAKPATPVLPPLAPPIRLVLEYPLAEDSGPPGDAEPLRLPLPATPPLAPVSIPTLAPAAAAPAEPRAAEEKLCPAAAPATPAEPGEAKETDGREEEDNRRAAVAAGNGCISCCCSSCDDEAGGVEALAAGAETLSPFVPAPLRGLRVVALKSWPLEALDARPAPPRGARKAGCCCCCGGGRGSRALPMGTRARVGPVLLVLPLLLLP